MERGYLVPICHPWQFLLLFFVFSLHLNLFLYNNASKKTEWTRENRPDRADVPRSAGRGKQGKREGITKGCVSWVQCVHSQGIVYPTRPLLIHLSRQCENGARILALGFHEPECDSGSSLSIHAMLANCGTSQRGLPHLQSGDDYTHFTV